jgi:dienelactone hydrolase
MRIKLLMVFGLTIFLSGNGSLTALPASLQAIPKVDVRDDGEMMTIGTWRICGPFVLSQGQNFTWYSNASESASLAHDYLTTMGGSESPLVLGPETTNLKIDFHIDVKNQVKGVEMPPLPYKPFFDQIQSFPSGVVSSQTLYWGFPKRFAITYASALLHSKRTRSEVLVVASNSPLKIWLNGAVLWQPAAGSVGHNSSDYRIVRVRLHAGVNSLLVKMLSFPERNEFSLHIGDAAQARKFLQENATFLDLLERIAVPDGSPLALDGNLSYLAQGSKKWSKLTIRDAHGSICRTAKLNLNKEHSVSTAGLQDGLYDLEVKIGKSNYTETFFLGDILSSIARYKSYCDTSRDQPNAWAPCAVLQPLQDRLSDAQMTTRLDKEKPLVLLLSQLEWSLHGNTPRDSLSADSRHVYLESYRSRIDGSSQYYYMHLPPDYFRQQAVPLVVVCPYDDHHKDFLVGPTNTLAPVLQMYAYWADKFGFAFIVSYARGIGMSNPNGLKDVLEALEDVQHKYKIDSTRIYLTGDCAGGRGALLLAEHAPQRFAAVSTLNAATNLQYVNYGDDEDDDDAPVDDGLYFRVGNLSKMPILLIHGDLYPHSPISRAYRFQERCMKRGFHPELVTLPGEGTLGLRDPIYLSFSFFRGKRISSEVSTRVSP